MIQFNEWERRGFYKWNPTYVIPFYESYAPKEKIFLCSWINWMQLLWYVFYHATFLTILHFFRFLIMLCYLICYVYLKTLANFSFMSSLYESLEILEEGRFGLDDSCCASIPNILLVWVSLDVSLRWHILEKKLDFMRNSSEWY